MMTYSLAELKALLESTIKRSKLANESSMHFASEKHTVELLCSRFLDTKRFRQWGIGDLLVSLPMQ